MTVDSGVILERNGLTRLSFNLSSDVGISKDLVPMINYHSKYLLSLELTEVAGGYVITYDVQSRISLSKFLRQNRANTVTILNILKGILTPLSLSKEKHLYIENFSYNIDYIFWDTLTSELRLVYFPYETRVEAIPALRILLSKIFEEFLTPMDNNETKYIDKIINCYKQKESNHLVLLRLIEEIEIDLRGNYKRLKKKSFFSRLVEKEEKILMSDDLEIVPENNPPPPSPVPIAEPKVRHGTELLIENSSTNNISIDNVSLMELSVNINDIKYQFEIKNVPCILGRSSQDANILLEDNSISRKHALIELKNGTYYITDINSKNGVSVNGIRLISGEAQALALGDSVKMGRAEIHITAIN